MYFHNCRKMYRISGDTEVLERMSPMLRGVVALEAHRPWLRRVWYLDPQVQYEEGSSVASELRSEQEAFVAKLACALVHCSFSSEERIPVGSLYILRKGLTSRGWKFLGPGRVWGEDLILNYPQLIDTTPTVALTYVEVAATSIASALTTFPATATLSSTALAASAHRHLRYHHRHLSHPRLTAGAPTRPCRHDGRGVDAPRRGRPDQARRGAPLPFERTPPPPSPPVASRRVADVRTRSRSLCPPLPLAAAPRDSTLPPEVAAKVQEEQGGAAQEQADGLLEV